MPDEWAERFIDALHHLEQTNDTAPIADLYAVDSETTNLASENVFSGREGAREFWAHYRSSFGEMNSSFRNVVVDGNRAALEWETTGTSTDGAPFRYDGVSILERGGDDGGITRFRAFFDPAALGRQLVNDAAARHGEQQGATASSTNDTSSGNAPSASTDGEIAPLTNADKVGDRSGTTGEAPTG